MNGPAEILLTSVTAVVSCAGPVPATVNAQVPPAAAAPAAGQAAIVAGTSPQWAPKALNASANTAISAWALPIRAFVCMLAYSGPTYAVRVLLEAALGMHLVWLDAASERF